jgi:exonuclease VII small subunit
MPTTIQDIENRARRYAEAREKLNELVTDLNAGIEALKRNALPELKRVIARASEHHDQLKAMIEAAPELFVKPKSVVFHGIKLGYQKGKGKIEWDDPDRVVALIKRHFPDQADVLIVTTERPAKEALNSLTATDLRRLGISVVDGGENVFIKPVDSAVDKMVDALLKGAIEEEVA